MIIVWATAGVAWMERSLRSVIQVLLAEMMIMASLRSTHPTRARPLLTKLVKNCINEPLAEINPLLFHFLQEWFNSWNLAHLLGSNQNTH